MTETVAASSRPSASRPNVLFITTDQWRGDLRPGGGDWLKTPKLDAFAAEAVSFAQHYTQAYPCGPARACMNTGLYQHKNRAVQNGTPLDARHRTIFQAARAGGYDPVLFGYTDTTADPRSLAPQDPERSNYMGVAAGLKVGCLLDEPSRPWIAHLFRQGVKIPQPWLGRAHVFDQAAFGAPTIFDAKDSETAFLADRIIDHLATQDPSQPFFLHTSFIAPHPPFAAAREWLEAIDPAAVPLSRRENDPSEPEHPLLAAYRLGLDMAHFAPGISGAPHLASDEVIRTMRHAYAALAAEADHHIGRIFDWLKAKGLWENTIVIFTADHGEELFDHGLLGKLGWYDGSAHVPLLIHAPGAAGGQTVTSLTGAIDIFPTLVDLLGLEPDVNLDGASLKPALKGAPLPPRDAVFWSHDFRNLKSQRLERHLGLSSNQSNLHVVRTQKLKYVHFSALPGALYDLENDPHETRNLIDDPAARAMRDEGIERLLNFRLTHETDELACYQGIGDQLYGTRAAWRSPTP